MRYVIVVLIVLAGCASSVDPHPEPVAKKSVITGLHVLPSGDTIVDWEGMWEHRLASEYAYMGGTTYRIDRRHSRSFMVARTLTCMPHEKNVSKGCLAEGDAIMFVDDPHYSP